MNSTKRLSLLGAALALIALACGGGTDDQPSNQPAPSTSVAGDLQTGGLTPLAACAEDTPDCQDTLVAGDEEPLFVDGEPDLGVAPGGSSGMVVGGGLTVDEALTTDAVGVIAVQGFVVADASGARLCSLLAESMPPQCGGATLELSDLTTVDPDELRSSQGVTWTDRPVTILGEVLDGILVPDALSL